MEAAFLGSSRRLFARCVTARARSANFVLHLGAFIECAPTRIAAIRRTAVNAAVAVGIGAYAGALVWLMDGPYSQNGRCLLSCLGIISVETTWRADACLMKRLLLSPCNIIGVQSRVSSSVRWGGRCGGFDDIGVGALAWSPSFTSISKARP